MLFRFLVFLFLSPFFLQANILEEAKPLGSCHFVVITIPKSGTHLLQKYLELAQGKCQTNITMALRLPGWNYFEPKKPGELDKKIQRLKKPYSYLISHSDLAAPALRFLNNNPDSSLLVNIRDLRDVLISQVYYEWDLIEKYVGPTDFTEKLWFLLKHDNIRLNGYLHTPLRHAEALIPLIKHPNCLTVRYEDFVGSEGGGNDDVQLALIFAIANHIQIPMTPEKATELQSILYGNKGKSAATFRSGKIGAWKEAFTKEQLRFFNEKFGKVQLQLGYTLDEA